MRDHGAEHFPIGSSVQLAVDSQWVGTFRVIAHSAGNLLVGRNNKIAKWPKCKTRLANLEDNDEMDQIHIPAEGRMWHKRRRWLMEEYPEEYRPAELTIEDSEGDNIPTANAPGRPLSEEELMEIGQRVLDSPDPMDPTTEDAMDVGVVIDAQHPGHATVEGTFVNHGSILCERITDVSTGNRLDSTSTTFPVMGPMLADGFKFGLADQLMNPHTAFESRRIPPSEYVDQDILDGFDPSRIPPRVAFKLLPARIAIEREITDLLLAKPNEPPAMIEIALNDSRYSGIPRVQSTLVVKRKGIGSYKGRLRVRGDTVPLQNTAFVSSPTAHRCAVKLICAFASQLQWVIHAIDISQAFLQSSNLNEKDRVIATPPPMIHLPWTGKLPPMNTDLGRLKHRRGFLLLRPLYGGRDAPMRWFLSLSKRLREYGFTQMKTDVCMFSKLDSHGNLAGILVAHVDDLLFFGTPTFRKEALQAIHTFRTGEVEAVTKTTPIIFTGMLIELDSSSILLSQQMYAGELPIMDIAEYLNGDRITNAAGLKSTFKQGLGALIWLHQTRPDIGFTVTQMATQIVGACESAQKAIQLARIYNKIVKFVKNHRMKIRYSPFPRGETDSPRRSSDLISWKLFVFTDAGFGTLIKNHSVESHVVILGDVIARDGEIDCHGLLLDHRCAEIHRVCRSTLSAESHAAVTAVDVALWFQVLLIEICTHRFEYQRLTPPTFSPLQNPFRESPSDAEVQKEAAENLIHATVSAFSHPAHPMATDTIESFSATCHCCKISRKLTTLSYHLLESPLKEQVQAILFQKPVILFHPLILTDCCSFYSATLRLQPKTVERCTRITLAFLRDAMDIIAFSFIDATVNLGDVWAKHAGNLGILDKFLNTNRFTLSFVGRKKRDKR